VHRPARWTSSRKSVNAFLPAKETLAQLRGFYKAQRFGYLPLGQLLEIIFTFCTVKLDCDPEAPPAPADADEPAAPAPLELPPASDPVMRTSWPTCSVNLEVSPDSCQVFPAVSVREKFPEEPLRHPSIEVLLVEVCVVSGAVLWVGEVCDGEVADGLDWSVDGCCVAGLDCATSQTLDSSRIDVIRYSFLICVLLILSACAASAAIESSWKQRY
jgi:hypothetical protein